MKKKIEMNFIVFFRRNKEKDIKNGKHDREQGV